MATKSDTDPVQIEIFPSRLLTPETAERVLGEIYKVGGVVRIMIQGPNQPRAVPYGPGKGTPIEENIDKFIELGDQALELRVKVGRIRLELEGEEYVDKVKAACERVLPFRFEFRRGHFFHGKSTLSDYAKYGSDVKDERILGLIDPKAKKERHLAILSDEGGDF
jgi:methyl-coenzyme M reductase subunit D